MFVCLSSILVAINFAVLNDKISIMNKRFSLPKNHDRKPNTPRSDNTINLMLGFLQEGEDISFLTAIFKQLTMEAKEKGLQVSLSDKPSILLTVKPLKGNMKFYIYEGRSIYTALDAAKRTTKFSEEQKNQLRNRLRRGFNIFPEQDGKFVMLGLKMKILCEGTIEQCLLAMDLNMRLHFQPNKSE